MLFSYEDVEPVALNEEQPQLCQILYTEEFKTTIGTLLALMQKNEYSERALALTSVGIELLASHYSIWIYRFNIIKNIKLDLYEELDWLEEISLDNEKNYQIWNYRQLIIGEITKTSEYNFHREFPILAAMLNEDSKNHHVWTYRKWFVSKFDLYTNDKENEFVDQLLELDVRNNSAWNHRFLLKFERKEVTSDLIDSELEYVKLKIKFSPQNESSWNYLLGIVAKFNIHLNTLEPFCKEFVNFQQDSIEKQAYDSNEIDLIKSSFALEVLAKIYSNKTSLEYYDLLIEKYDPIRANYWKYLKSRIVV